MAVNSIKIATANSGGVTRKKAAIENFLFRDNIEILGITEVKAKSFPKFRGFNAIHRRYPAQQGQRETRGVAILIKKGFAFSEHQLPNNLQHLDCIAVDTYIDSNIITFFTYYNSPRQCLSNELMQYAASLPKAIILGDFNARHTDFGDTLTNRNGHILIDAISNLPLYRIPNSSPTHINHWEGYSIVDHILVTDSLSNRASDSANIGTTITSDHLPLVFDLSVSKPRTPTPEYIIIRDSKNTDWEKFRIILEKEIVPLDPTTTPEEIERQVFYISELIQDAYLQCTPEKQIPLHKTPLPPEIVDKIRLKRQVYREYINTRDPDIKTQWNRLNATIRRDINRHREKLWRETCSGLNYRDGKRFWNKLKILTGQKSNPRHFLKVNNQFITTDTDKANAYAKHLEKIFQIPEDPLFNDSHKKRVETFHSQFIHRTQARTCYITQADRHKDTQTDDVSTVLEPIQLEEIATKIHLLKNNKAPGNDNIKNITLKHLPHSVLQAIVQIFNNCLSTSYFPCLWKSGIAIMIQKPGKPPDDPNSYRPVTLLSGIGKLFERIITERLRNFCEGNSLFPPTQFGFRAQRSTCDPLTALQTDVARHLNLGQCVLGVFLDIEKAFDKVWHAGLIYKLKQLHFSDQLTQLIHSFLSHRTLKVREGNELSNPISINAGVPQGSVLSPLLYLIYCHDIPIKSQIATKTILFADDTALWTGQKTSFKATQVLQECLDEFQKWASKWRIKPNPTKSSAILFRNGHQCQSWKFQTRNIHLSLWNIQIPLSNEVRYLGISFHKYGNFSSDLNATLRKVRQRAGIISRLRGGLQGCSSETLHHTYKTFIRPVIEFRAVLYVSLNSPEIERLISCERKILRKIFDLYFKFPSERLYEHIGAHSINERLKKLQSSYVLRTLRSQNEIAKQTLRTSWTDPHNKNLSTSQTFPSKPKMKKVHLPSALLEITARENELSASLENIIEETPLSIRVK
ncbi:putative RNA-directed DNA polymerase from transposon X-element-like Protein [Tribolium castaneum]|uniref:Putative RNA-directed DNA polymerase from transposon X-element-like Protein n=1 Tax=Tribolium castaneum TaxID=7070 RepID=D7GXY3_TRICA|nr:PREDICTED: probable RNA-directed DNA polymerase from transposon X-element [Tribolium castaneum]EFA13629.1 putative RNA-directed DNA polymerase from transposon X-element-like Protein [Tribolium castaneum]|eukprot:XP_973868.1 PREDICTED: probable RNA-directed DNA polymerase from transposon X-element [Tribolium castaneum]